MEEIIMFRKQEIKPVWTFSLNKGEEVENILSLVFDQFREFLSALPLEPDAAYSDFFRGVSIGDKSGNGLTKEEVSILLDGIIDSAKEYYKGDKGKVKEWIERQGGQRVIRLLNFIIESGFLSASPGDISIMKSLLEKINWRGSSNGCELEISIFVHSVIKNDDDEVISYNLKEKKFFLIKMLNYVQISSQYDEKSLIPLIHFQANIKLEVIKGEVTPIITFLSIKSYSDYLSNPCQKKLKRSSFM